MRVVNLAPSDFAFLLDDCPRCWWLKTRGVKRQSDMVPAVFRSIDANMKTALDAPALRSLGIPATAVRPEKFLQSAFVDYEDRGVRARLWGSPDIVVETECGLGVVELKSTRVKERTIPTYRRQMHSYVQMLEDPDKGDGEPVVGMWLVCFDPTTGRFKISGQGAAAITGGLWTSEVEIDRPWFAGVMDRAVDVIGNPDIPAPSNTCTTCNHLAEMRRYLGSTGIEELAA